ncbi:MAG: nucleotide exchange factor GrpE [Thermoprotei archaeon]
MSQSTAEQGSNQPDNKGSMDASTQKGEVEQLREEVKRLSDQLEKEKKRSDELLNSLKYLKADYENLVKRTNREIDEIKKVASERVIKEVIDLKEIVEGALKMIRDKAEPAIVEGLELILSKIDDILESESVVEIQAEGARFDPYYHEVVGVVESDKPDGVIVDVVRRGYIMNGRVIRPCMVRVSKHSGVSQVA